MASASSYTKTDEEKRLCNEWLKDPLTNPKTGMPIELKGPTYLYWQKRCKELGLSYKPMRSKELSFRKCQEWRKTPHINPETGKQIMIGGTLYKSIEKRCKNVTEKAVVLKGNYFLPDSHGLIPAVKATNGIFYIVRHATANEVGQGAEHLLYGPNNALTYKSRTNLVYFKDTWDYRQGYYKPIFKGGSEPPRPNPSQIRVNNTPYTSNTSNSNPKSAVDTLVNLFVSRK